jgi:hypothetical protein
MERGTMGFQCPNCGTSIEGTERFCRKCGTRILPEDLHEASTRSLDASTGGVRPGAPLADPGPYAPPQYMPPAGGPMVQGPSPYPLGAPSGQVTTRRSWLKIFGIALLVCILTCGVGAIFFGNMVAGIVRHRIDEKRSAASQPSEAPAPPATDMPEAVPPVPDGAPEDLSDELKPWWYPGAKIDAVVENPVPYGPKQILTMKSSDDPKKVAAYYRERIPKNAMVARDGNETTLQFKGGLINIEPSDGG